MVTGQEEDYRLETEEVQQDGEHFSAVSSSLTFYNLAKTTETLHAVCR